MAAMALTLPLHGFEVLDSIALGQPAGIYAGSTAQQASVSADKSDSGETPLIEWDEVVSWWDDLGLSGGWKGYLAEKGPTQLRVVREFEPQMESLSADMWAMIEGPPPPPPEPPPPKIQEKNTLLASQASEAKPAESTKQEKKDEKAHIDRNVIDDESIRLEDARKTHEKLMELFSQPVFAMPLRNPDEGEGRISFRMGEEPSNNGSTQIRQGSRARFEIRRNP
jgi:hypothetical protein